jgi:hypothetical protein
MHLISMHGYGKNTSSLNKKTYDSQIYMPAGSTVYTDYNSMSIDKYSFHYTHVVLQHVGEE